MAFEEDTEDVIRNSAAPAAPAAPNTAEEDLEEDNDAAPDYRLFASTAASSNSIKSQSSSNQKVIPSRGIKDFQPHGTNTQISQLVASRQAMYNVLSTPRAHEPDGSRNATPRAVWVIGKSSRPEDYGAWCEKSGKWSVGVGTSREVPNRTETVVGKNGDLKIPLRRLWIGIEECLWLVESHRLDLRWPIDSTDQKATEEMEEFGGDVMAIQDVWACLAGMGQRRLEEYTVYQYLRRASYIVVRAEENWKNVPHEVEAQTQTTYSEINPEKPTWITILEKLLSPKPINSRLQAGPLIKPGLYSDYSSIYSRLSVISIHDPNTTKPLLKPTSASSPTITYHVYKPNSHFKKSAPGPPDFYVSVINARNSLIPTEPELEALLRQTPFRHGENSIYIRARKGMRRVILAIVDNGLTSFLNFSDVYFTANKMYEKKLITRTKSSNSRNKKKHDGR